MCVWYMHLYTCKHTHTHKTQHNTTHALEHKFTDESPWWASGIVFGDYHIHWGKFFQLNSELTDLIQLRSPCHLWSLGIIGPHLQGKRNLISRPHTCVAQTLYSESSPQPALWILIRWYRTAWNINVILNVKANSLVSELNLKVIMNIL